MRAGAGWRCVSFYFVKKGITTRSRTGGDTVLSHRKLNLTHHRTSGEAVFNLAVIGCYVVVNRFN